ncbi:uncharacterized protein LOC121735352 [Aricia agestis]|uniref:uncharacterized protein LOC121735352 n=1 Tax=Aricia agestis TaxID=91739 RepID=UPI001C20B50B|nr:uncharacterized protein LOC121735352 [Aricia agestis]
MKIDTEKVIYEVQQRPLLWHRRNELYKSRAARAAAWLEICHEVIPNFEDLTEDEQTDIDKKIQQRWRTARDMYKKEKMADNQGFGAKKKKKYEHFKSLTFLDKEIEGTEDSLPEADDEPSSPTMPPFTFVPLIPSSDPTHQQANPAHPPQKRRATSEYENSLTEHPKRHRLELEGEDLAFFQSLQPSLKRFTNYQKLMFRTRVMQVIMEMDSQNMNCAACGQDRVVIKEEGDF